MSEEEKDELIQKLFNIIQKAQLAVPILEGYQEVKEAGNAIFVAKAKDNSIEQFLDDGKLEENETFEQRIEKVIKDTVEAMKDNNLINPQLDSLGTFNTKLFKFQLYIQDNIKDEKIIRQINAYFVEPESKHFYEITLSAPPMPLKVANEQVIKNILNNLTYILENIKYNNQNPIKNNH